MTLTFPRADILSIGSVVQLSFRLVSLQEIARSAGGVIAAKDMGPAIWQIEATTIPRTPDDEVTFEAALHSLDGSVRTFSAYDLRRPYPLAHATGLFDDSGYLHTVDSDKTRIRIGGLPENLTLSPGDYLAFDYGGSRALHQVVESAVASGGGLTPLFEVRPHIRSGYSTGTGTPVTLKRASGIFALTPDGISIQSSGPRVWSATIKAIQVI